MPKYIVKQVTEFAVEAPSELDAVVFAELNMGLGRKDGPAESMAVVKFPPYLEPHKFSIT